MVPQAVLAVGIFSEWPLGGAEWPYFNTRPGESFWKQEEPVATKFGKGCVESGTIGVGAALDGGGSYRTPRKR